jgi:hypothetical protein
MVIWPFPITTNTNIGSSTPTNTGLDGRIVFAGQSVCGDHPERQKMEEKKKMRKLKILEFVTIC